MIAFNDTATPLQRYTLIPNYQMRTTMALVYLQVCACVLDIDAESQSEHD
jgi:hypothetical protein